MNKICFFVSVFFYLTSNLSGQVPDRVSLFEKLTTVEDDSNRAVLYNTIARTYVRNKQDSAIYFFNKALQTSANIEAPLFQSHTLSFMSMTYSIWGKQDSAKIQLEKAAIICKINNLDSALHQVYFGLGNVVESQGNLGSALEYYYLALEHFESKKYLKSLNRTKANVSYIHLKTGEYEKARRLILESNSYYKKNGADRQLMNGYSRLGTLFSETESPDSAILYLERAKSLAKKLNANFELAKLYLNTGNALSEIGSYQSARANYLEAINLMEDNGAEPGDLLNAYTSIMLCNEYLRINDGIDYEKRSIEQLDKTQDLVDIRAYYEKMAKVDSIRGDLESSLQNFKRFKSLEKDLFNENISKQLLDIETKYETEKIKFEKLEAENKTSAVQAESKRNRLLFIGSVLVAVLIVVSILFYNAKQKQARKAEEVLKNLESSQKQLAIEKQYRDSELKALKAQMNPHFIFNVLNSIQEYIVLNNKEKASDYLSMFAHLIRSYLDQSGKKDISLQEEAETLDRYLQLEALRFEENFSAKINVSEDLDQELIKLPPMIIQPYVENAIKHGLFNKQGGKKLDVVVEKQAENMLKCTIQDNGIGRKAAAKIKAAKPNMHESFALGATQSRIELHNQHSKNKISIETVDLYDKENKSRGTKVSLIIPLQS